MSDDGSMAFITSQLELIKEVIEKYKKVRTSLSYRIVIILKNTDLLLRMKGKSLLMLLKQAKSLKPKCI